MRIFFTGGAGLIGRTTVERLASAGHEVVSVVLQPSPDGVPQGVTELVGDAGDPALVDAGMAPGIDAVVHFAAIPSPADLTAVELLKANTLTTMTVLEAAGRAGVGTVVIASSVSALGMAWADGVMHPLYLPVDENHSLRPTEGYGLSKEMDEASARMAARRWGMTAIALRFPFTATEEMIRARAGAAATDPAVARSLAKELWAYLDVRDAARAVELAIEAARAGRVCGAVVVNVMADDVILDSALPDLLEEWHPGTPIVGELGRCAYSTEAARSLFGFTAELLHGPPVNRKPPSPEESHE